MNNLAMTLIAQTLQFGKAHYEAKYNGDGVKVGGGRTIYDDTFVCAIGTDSAPGFGPPPKKTKDPALQVRVVVNPKTNNIITAYIIERDLDANPNLAC